MTNTVHLGQWHSEDCENDYSFGDPDGYYCVKHFAERIDPIHSADVVIKLRTDQPGICDSQGEPVDWRTDALTSRVANDPEFANSLLPESEIDTEFVVSCDHEGCETALMRFRPPNSEDRA